jgi:hypothetical protein
VVKHHHLIWYLTNRCLSLPEFASFLRTLYFIGQMQSRGPSAFLLTNTAVAGSVGYVHLDSLSEAELERHMLYIDTFCSVTSTKEVG